MEDVASLCHPSILEPQGEKKWIASSPKHCLHCKCHQKAEGLSHRCQCRPICVHPFFSSRWGSLEPPFLLCPLPRAKHSHWTLSCPQEVGAAET